MGFARWLLAARRAHLMATVIERLGLLVGPAKSFAMADFKKLRGWQEAHALTIDVIRACEDIAGNVGTIVRNQLIRAMMSVPSNVAEGSAKKSDREFARYVRISLGSAAEVENHLILARDLDLLKSDRFDALDEQLQKVQKMLTGLEKRLTSDSSWSFARSA